MNRHNMFQNSQAIVELSSVDGEKYVMFGLEADGNNSLSDRMGAIEAIQKSTESRLDRVEDSLLKMSGMLERVVNNQQSARPSESSSSNQAILILSEQIKLGHERQEALMMSLLDKDRQVVTQLVKSLEILQNNCCNHTQKRSCQQNPDFGSTDDTQTEKNYFIQISDKEIKNLKAKYDDSCVAFIGQLLIKSFPPKHFVKHKLSDISQHQLKKLFDITRGQFKIIKRRNSKPPHELSLQEFKTIVGNKISSIRYQVKRR